MRIKSRANPLKFLTMFILLITLTFIPTVFADNTTHNPGTDNAETESDDHSSNQGSDAGGATGTDAVHPWSAHYLGYRVYVLDKYNNPMTEAKDIWFGKGTAEEVLREVMAYNGSYYRVPRGNIASSLVSRRAAETYADGNLPVPWSGMSSTALMLESWLYAPDEETGVTNGKQMTIELFGSDVWKGWVEEEDNEYYLVMEGLTLFDIYAQDNTYTGKVFAGSGFNWGVYCSVYGWKAGGAELRRGTNGIFAVSQMMEYDWLNKYENLKTVTKKTVGKNPNNINDWITTELLCQYGYDTTAYTFTKLNGSMTHTWDKEGCGNTPGPAPKVEEDLEDKVGIVKVYCTKDPETNTVISWDGSYFRDNNPRTIVVEDEEDYKVEEWYTSKTKGTSAPGTWPATKSVYPGSVQGPSGGPGTVTLDPDKLTFERTLCVLLVKYPEEEELESELIIEESEISIYRKLSEVSDFNLSDTKIESVPKVPNIRDKV